MKPDELVNKYSATLTVAEMEERDASELQKAVAEAEQPTYVSPLMALLTGAKGAPQLIEIPEPSPELQKRIAQLEKRRDQEVGKARDRAYDDPPTKELLAARGIGRPIHDHELSPEALAWLNERRAEWNAWHEVNGDTWRPDGGELDVSGLP
jgi:hypothetical protein